MDLTSDFQPISSCSLSLKLLVIATLAIQAIAQDKVFSVLDHGAIADGKTDNSKAFASAWEEACAWDGGNAKVLIPEGSYLTHPVNFAGPCKRPIELQLHGTVQAPSDPHVFPTTDWVMFKYLNNLTINGNGKFHGQGKEAWSLNDCLTNSKCSIPTSVKLAFVNDSIVQGISSVDSKMFHFLVFKCNNLQIHDIKITAPEDSPNTDGIHITRSTNINVTETNIATGDDCISIGPGNDRIFISKVFCGPGHGISVGSLGKVKSDIDVTNVNVKNCTFTGTMNGVRVKTWKDSYVLSLSNFNFDDLIMNDVSNPIIIDQEYCPAGGCTGQPPSRVKINNVKFTNIRGTSASEVAVNLKCSETEPCRQIELSDVHLTYSGERENVVATAACSNAFGTSHGTMTPESCI